jgi:hypothetical protein
VHSAAGCDRRRRRQRSAPADERGERINAVRVNVEDDQGAAVERPQLRAAEQAEVPIGPVCLLGDEPGRVVGRALGPIEDERMLARMLAALGLAAGTASPRHGGQQEDPPALGGELLSGPHAAIDLAAAVLPAAHAASS